MSAFGGKADMTFCENPLSRSLLGAKRTWCALPGCLLGGTQKSTLPIFGENVDRRRAQDCHADTR
jgi:hypothetical protein